jgi:DNA-directed RNA polymerase subunit RPC12/RpoP
MPLQILCAWCGAVIVKGERDEQGRSSHGICPTCLSKVLAQSGLSEEDLGGEETSEERHQDPES